MDVMHVNDANFDAQVISSKEPVLVDFWAEWCAPCKKVAPVVSELSKEYKGKVKVVKVNIDEGRQVATKFTIMAVPTFMLFKDGKIMRQVSGAVSKSELKSILDKVI
jgi:thioredoxin 1